MSSMTRVAFFGLGRMGAPMAANIARAGFPVVVYNRTRSKAESLAAEHGMSVADSPKAAAADADVLITMLADEASVQAVYEGELGALSGMRSGAVAVDMGTTGPQGVARLAAQVAQRGGSLVDAPVSGSTAAATAGTLTILAGGEDSALDAVDAVLRSVGSTVYRMGCSGSGAIMKLAVNNVIYGLGQAISESLVLAERSGLDRALAYEVFMNSAVAAPMVKYRRDAFVQPEDTPAAFAMSLAAKDLRLIQALADEVGAPMPQAAVNHDVLDEAIQRGLGDQDMAAVAVHLRTRGGG